MKLKLGILHNSCNSLNSSSKIQKLHKSIQMFLNYF